MSEEKHHPSTQPARDPVARQVSRAREAERARISRDLHDQLGQDFSALLLRLGMLRQAPGLPPAARGEIEHLEAIARRLDADIDFVVRQARPAALNDLGLDEALREYVDAWSQHFEVDVHHDLRHLAENRLEHEVETVLYRAVQEALNNVAKHSNATRAGVAVVREADDLVLSIEDNGRGFDPKAAMAAGSGLGLVGMRERAALVGGSFDIRSQSGGGTTVSIRVPMGREGAR